MKRLQFIILIFIVSINLGAKNLVYPKGFEPKKESQAITFTENKGQVSDQNNKPRPDVLYGGNAKGMVFHLRNDGISYQLNRVDSWKTEDTLFNPHHRMMPGENKKVRDQISIYRIDINWLNCNKNFTLQPDDSLPGYSNYYHEVCPNGVHDVKTYKGVTYKNIYNNIDLHYYEKGGNLKYDYIVAPYTDYKQIQLQIEGAEKITLQKDGSVLIKTALGDIAEDAPIIYQDGAKLQSKWTLKNNILGFEVASYNPAYELIIDPVVRSWGTYYGGIGQDYSYYSNACATDISGNVYFTGQAASSTGTILATSGSHQVMIDGSTDAFLAKFNGNGIRQWGTYYGGSGGEIGYSCALDGSGNVFMAGTTTSSVGTVLSTSGAHQVIHGGGPSLNAQDAFLVKFNNNGVRSWGTYYGGSGNDLGYGCTCDGTGNVFLVGETSTNSGTAIATAASHQPTGAGAFLVKFSGGGVRQWGTYYGQFNWARSCATDATGNVFITGVSYGGTLIATPGSHQPTGIAQDAYLAKFNSSGVRQWGTYYGGAGTEWGLSCSVDPSGNIFMSGITNVNSGTVIATLGCHQPA